MGQRSPAQNQVPCWRHLVFFLRGMGEASRVRTVPCKAGMVGHQANLPCCSGEQDIPATDTRGNTLLRETQISFTNMTYPKAVRHAVAAHLDKCSLIGYSGKRNLRKGCRCENHCHH